VREAIDMYWARIPERDIKALIEYFLRIEGIEFEPPVDLIVVAPIYVNFIVEMAVVRRFGEFFSELLRTESGQYADDEGRLIKITGLTP
jgi:hypothetical protein